MVRKEYKEKEKLYADEINNISAESAKEIEEWVRLTDNFREKLNAAKARIKELENANRMDKENEDVSESVEVDGAKAVKGNGGVNEVNSAKKEGGWV